MSARREDSFVVLARFSARAKKLLCALQNPGSLSETALQKILAEDEKDCLALARTAANAFVTRVERRDLVALAADGHRLVAALALLVSACVSNPRNAPRSECLRYLLETAGRLSTLETQLQRQQCGQSPSFPFPCEAESGPVLACISAAFSLNRDIDICIAANL